MEETADNLYGNYYLSSINNLLLNSNQEVILGVDNMNIIYLWALQV